ncbi:MAG: universal stress protein [Pseudomonadota bacterium]
MARVLACIDGSIYSASTAGYAAWAAARLEASVLLLQVIGRREAGSEDRSGALAPGARRKVLEELAELDAQRARLIQQQARLDLQAAEAALREVGVADVKTLLRNGDLLDALADREGETDLFVLGKRGGAADFAKGHLGSNLERILRAAKKPVLIAAREFSAPPKRFVLAFDGRASALRAVEELSRSPLVQGMSGLVVHAGDPAGEGRRLIEAAASQLRAGGLEVETHAEAGETAAVIRRVIDEGGPDLLVMGAYGHSRLRTLMIGSTTTEMIRTNRAPVLVYR